MSDSRLDNSIQNQFHHYSFNTQQNLDCPDGVTYSPSHMGERYDFDIQPSGSSHPVVRKTPYSMSKPSMNLSHAGDHNTVLLEEERRCRKGEFNNPKLFSARLREYGSHLCLTITEQPVIWDFSGYLEYVCLHDKDGNQWWVHDQFFEKQLRLDETSLDPTFTYRKDEKALQVMIHSPNNDSSESEDLSLTKHASRFPPLWTPDGRVLLTWYDQAGLQKGWRALRAIPGLPMTVSSIIPAWLMEAISQCHSSIKTQDFVDRQRPDLRSGVTPKTWDCRRRAARKKYNFVKEPASSYV